MNGEPMDRNELEQLLLEHAYGCVEDPEAVDLGGEAHVPTTGEASHGFLLWHSLTRALSLTVNIRSPGLLARLLAEMRAGQIAVFISRKDSKLYVRQNFAPLLEVPVPDETEVAARLPT